MANNRVGLREADRRVTSANCSLLLITTASLRTRGARRCQPRQGVAEQQPIGAQGVRAPAAARASRRPWRSASVKLPSTARRRVVAAAEDDASTSLAPYRRLQPRSAAVGQPRRVDHGVDATSSGGVDHANTPACRAPRQREAERASARARTSHDAAPVEAGAGRSAAARRATRAPSTGADKPARSCCRPRSCAGPPGTFATSARPLVGERSELSASDGPLAGEPSAECRRWLAATATSRRRHASLEHRRFEFSPEPRGRAGEQTRGSCRGALVVDVIAGFHRRYSRGRMPDRRAVPIPVDRASLLGREQRPPTLDPVQSSGARAGAGYRTTRPGELPSQAVPRAAWRAPSLLLTAGAALRRLLPDGEEHQNKPAKWWSSRHRRRRRGSRKPAMAPFASVAAERPRAPAPVATQRAASELPTARPGAPGPTLARRASRAKHSRRRVRHNRAADAFTWGTQVVPQPAGDLCVHQLGDTSALRSRDSGVTARPRGQDQTGARVGRVHRPLARSRAPCARPR